MNEKQFRGWLANHNQPSLIIQKPLIMGIVNVTPNSFSDGGQFLSMDRACEHAFHLITEGADLIDVGGESTKPGSLGVSVEEELSRVIPVIEHIRANSDICISIDTTKAAVMKAAVAAGANFINDINALRSEDALEMAASLDVPVCLMHMQGSPQNMQNDPHYAHGVMAEVMEFFVERLNACDRVGIRREHIVLDPGFGFGKLAQDNLALVRHISHFSVFKKPLLLGVSRKSTIGAVLAKEVGQRLIGSIALAVYAAMQGVGIIRTHDVDETQQAMEIIHRVMQAEEAF